MSRCSGSVENVRSIIRMPLTPSISEWCIFV